MWLIVMCWPVMGSWLPSRWL
ncbi:rCG58464 [Rattus norvegicus]|uniref:RCG58464 n=1 Tax=Rattus norvegicus TaxID=10116 RepID=A6J5A3_RAT|nr:rCG58464 [Rattus norvegicus]